MNIKFPAPWTAESYQSQSGHRIWEVRDGLGQLVIAGASQEQAEAIAASRNESTAMDDINQLTDAYQGAIDALNADLARVRELWHKEVAENHAQIYRYREEIAALKLKSAEGDA